MFRDYSRGQQAFLNAFAFPSWVSSCAHTNLTIQEYTKESTLSLLETKRQPP